jgi:hypothetical protein
MGYGSIVFTRLYDDAADIAWSKQGAEHRMTPGAEMAAEPLLYQNYPNPVSLSVRSAATIPVFLPTDNYVILRIFNLYGQLVETLQEGHLRAGAHSFKFTPASKGFPSGTYFYSLITRDRTETRSMNVVH